MELRRHAYQAGEIRIVALIAAQQQLLEVELKLAKTPSERREVLAQQLQLAKAAEKVAITLVTSGVAPQGDVLRARIARLGVEVSILEDLE